MAKSTATKVHRNFIGRSFTKVINGQLTMGVEEAKRFDKIKAKDRHVEPCRYCNEAMMVADGQIALFHAKCRTKVRSLRNQGKGRK